MEFSANWLTDWPTDQQTDWTNWLINWLTPSDHHNLTMAKVNFYSVEGPHEYPYSLFPSNH